MDLPPQSPSTDISDQRIETERLVLRPPRLADFDMFFEGARLVPPLRADAPPLDRTAAWAKFTRNAGIWALLGHGVFVVTDRGDGSYLGETGLARFGRGIPAMNDAPEAAWVFLARAHGRGIAHEAAQAAHDWFFERHGAQRTVCMIDPENTPSLALAAKLGYVSFGEGEHEGKMLTLLERLP